MSPGPAFGEAGEGVTVPSKDSRDDAKESASSARSTRPKWRLCFRLDRRSASPKESLEDLAPKYQRDFFLTVIDPPCRGAFRQNPPAPFFASRAACHVADLLASRHMIAQLPGRSFEQKAVAVIGSECLAAGLVAATLGAKALFVCERSLEQYYQHNLRLFRRDTLDYTKTKSKILAVYPCSPGRTGGFDPEMLANKLQAPSLDIIVLTEVSLARVAGEMGGIAGREAGFFRFLESLIPARSCTKALVVCDQSFAELMEEPRDRRGPRRTDEDVPAWLKGEGAPPGLAQVLPADWQARTFCQLPQGIPVVWLERQDAERVKRRAPPLVSRPPMPPMGASSSRCGCGGHLQSPLLGQRVENQEWFAKNAKLKEALMSHNSWKHLEANNVLREARAWADSVSLRTSVMGSQELPSEASQADATSSASQRDAGLSSLYHSGSKLLRKTLPPSTAREVRPKLHDISRSSGSRSARLTGPNIAERHASPPFWYSCNRAVYGPPPNPPAE